MTTKRRGSESPGRSPRPAADYSKRQRGGGNGRPIPGGSPDPLARARAGMPSTWEGQAKVEDETDATGTSIFDPVLCEIAYRWFCPPGGTVIDPFAGGSVRGIVAAVLGLRYVGHELRQAQVMANIEQWQSIAHHPGVPRNAPLPQWIVGDSVRIDETVKGVDADLVFTCPPYADLEVYSDDPADISNMPYEQFLAAYRVIIAKTCAMLRPHRFACVVIGEVRDRKGDYRGLVPDTIQAFRDAGLTFYNEAILITSAGSLPIRAGKQFTTSRKLGKTHQQVLVFLKGNAKKAVEACGPVVVDAALLAA